MSVFTVEVIDTQCQDPDKSFFPPAVSMTTVSTTQVATIYGYGEYIASSPPKKYKNLTFTGTAEQIAYVWGPNPNITAISAQIADIKYVYSGTSTVDGHGNKTSQYAKNMYLACPTGTFTPLINSNLPVESILALRGYCYHPDPQSCPSCSYPPLPPIGNPLIIDWTTYIPQFAANVSRDNPIDFPFDLYFGSAYVISDSMNASLTGTPSVGAFLLEEAPGFGVVNFPKQTINGILGPWASLYCNYNVTATLSDEFTDAFALANAQVITSNSTIAENLPRTTGYVSRFTSVVYTLSFTRLLVAQNYVATVQFVTSTGALSSKTYNFTATDTVHTITDTVPNPIAQQTVTVRSPKVAFAP